MSKLLFDDAATARLILKHTAEIHGETRHYYAATETRAIVVLRRGLTLSDVRGRVTDAAIGWDERGDPRFVLPHNIGKRHSKATIHRVLEGAGHDLTLSDFLNRAPK
ncbi:MAG: hypothetical protein HY741_14100 [Chloroflexi bacterium]|nr:hypothetical protein [Chloroflexota bacterium]